MDKNEVKFSCQYYSIVKCVNNSLKYYVIFSAILWFVFVKSFLMNYFCSSFNFKTLLETNQSLFSPVKIYHDFKQITKAGLAISVVFSSIAGYLLGFDGDKHPFNWLTLLMLTVGGYCMVGASNAFNQVIEKDLDALMDRTKNRPVPSGRMSPNVALFVASLLTIVGLILLYLINPKTAMFGAISIFLYTSVYTPLKAMTPLSVFVGAFPGAIPFMLGWVAATNHFGIEAGTLFMIQFSGSFHIFGPLVGFCLRIMKKQVSSCCLLDKEIINRNANYIVYIVAYCSIIVALFRVYRSVAHWICFGNFGFYFRIVDVAVCR